MKTMTWKCNVEYPTECRYGMMLGTDLLMYLEIKIKNTKHVIEGNDGTQKGYTTPMVDLNN